MNKNWEAPGAVAEGYVAPGYEAVAQEFARNFSARGDVGAGFAAVVEGRPVVDLWCGMAAPGRRWQRDTLQVIYSGTKGLLAACLLKLVEQSRLDLDAPMARYWPEFAQNGKELVLVRHVVSHSSGLPGIMAPLTIEDIADDRGMEQRLAEQALPADPNAFRTYHALTVGWLAGGLVRHIDGRTLGQFFAEEFAGPLGLDIWIGLPEPELGRVGQIEHGPGMGAWDDGLTDAERSDPVRRSIWSNPALFPAQGMAWNTPLFHTAQIGGAGGIATARSMARYYGCMAMGGTIDGVTVLQPQTVQLGRRELSRFMDPYIAEAMAFGVLWALQTEQGRFGPAPDAFGHSGAGGSIHGAWPSQRTGFSYTMNQMRGDPEDLRSRPLLKALYEIVA